MFLAHSTCRDVADGKHVTAARSLLAVRHGIRDGAICRCGAQGPGRLGVGRRAARPDHLGATRRAFPEFCRHIRALARVRVSMTSLMPMPHALLQNIVSFLINRADLVHVHLLAGTAAPWCLDHLMCHSPPEILALRTC
jgi:hypothetical protein